MTLRLPFKRLGESFKNREPRDVGLQVERNFDEIERWSKGISISPSQILVAAADSPDIYKRAATYVCDGEDDQVEINEACAAVVTADNWYGGEVTLAPGTFHITGTVEVGVTRLRGLGGWGYSGPAIFVGDIGNVPAVRVGIGGALEGVYIDGQENDFRCGVDASFSSRVEHCYITMIGPRNPLDGDPAASVNACHGILAQHGDYIDNVITYCSGDGIQAQSGGSVTRFTGNYILRVGGRGIYAASFNVFVTLNEIATAGTALASPSSAGGGIVVAGQSSVVADNYISNPQGPGVLLDGASFSSVSGNYIHNPSQEAVHVSSAFYARVFGNFIACGAGHGVHLDGAEHAAVSENVITHSSASASISGIHLTAANYCFITGNKVYAENRPSDMLYGIRIDASSTSNVVVNNDLTQGVYSTSPLSDSGITTVLSYPGGFYGDNFT